jgi:hypothetical protein
MKGRFSVAFVNHWCRGGGALVGRLIVLAIQWGRRCDYSPLLGWEVELTLLNFGVMVAMRVPVTCGHGVAGERGMQLVTLVDRSAPVVGDGFPESVCFPINEQRSER